jgi:hypothetical protein
MVEGTLSGAFDRPDRPRFSPACGALSTDAAGKSGRVKVVLSGNPNSVNRA